MNILLIGSGGREHALAWAIANSPLTGRLHVAPGNAGIAQEATCVALDTSDPSAVIAYCRDQEIGLVVVGPEGPLVAGLVDELMDAGIKTFGPRKAPASLEGSKGFTKDLCTRAAIPTAAYGRFTDAAAAKAYVAKVGTPIVVKADGLAAGKGVVVAMTEAEALAAIDACFDGEFGAAGAEVVVEEFLEGEEASLFVLSDGRNVLPLASAQDHKRVGEGDTGPNTGGMGAYSPAPVMTEELTARAMREIVEPTVETLAAEGTPFVGVLYAGLMMTKDGPKLIEYNVRFGDPECQVLMMRLKDDIVTLMLACIDGTLDTVGARWRDEVALTVVLAANGYPGVYDKGTVIHGLEGLEGDPALKVFHAGTRRDDDGRLLANGGRVLNVTALGRTVAEARERAYAAIERIDWPEGFCRRDIGWRAVAREDGTA